MLWRMLIFEAPSRESATRFLRGDRDAALDRVTPLFSRWARSLELGASADSGAFPQVTSDSDLVDRRERLASVFRENDKATLFGALHAKLSSRSCVAVLADAEGYVLATQGFGALPDPALRVGLVEGARWSESVRGTNAVGTAIAERQAVAVIGAAHFELRNHGIFCYGHPIFDAYGDLVAVLDVTGPIEEHSREIGPGGGGGGIFARAGLAADRVRAVRCGDDGGHRAPHPALVVGHVARRGERSRRHAQRSRARGARRGRAVDALVPAALRSRVRRAATPGHRGGTRSALRDGVGGAARRARHRGRIGRSHLRHPRPSRR